MKRKVFSILFALVLVISFSLIPAMPASAVVDPVENIDTAETFTTIQAAIDDADTVDGHTIRVAAGNYGVWVTINKELTLLGANAGIHPAVGTHPTETVGTRGPESIITGATAGTQVVKVQASNITIDGFKFTTKGHQTITSATDANNFHLTNCIFDNYKEIEDGGVIQFASGSHTDTVFDFNLFQDQGARDQGGTIYAGGDFSRLRIAYNKFNGLSCGVFWTAAPLVDGIVEGNEFASGVGLNIGKGGNIIIRNNWFHDMSYTSFQVGIIGGSVTGNTFEGTCPLSLGGGSWYASDAFQLWGGEWGTPVSTDVIITGNTINFNNQSNDADEHGINLRPGVDAPNIHINWNNFIDGGVSDTALAVRNQGTGIVDATYDWWGDPSGPSHSPGLGAKVSDNVLCFPWLDAPYPAGNPVSSTLDVSITSPEDGARFNISQTFAVTALITNPGTSVAENVFAFLDIAGNADFVEGDSPQKELGAISPGSTQEAQWTLHCAGSGDVTIKVVAEATNGLGGLHEIIVQQLGAPAIDIVITSPPNMTKIGYNTFYTVTARATNTGLEPLTDVGAWLIIGGGGNAAVQGSPIYTWPGNPWYLDKQQYVDIEWTLKCTGVDIPTNYTTIEAEAEGTGEATLVTVMDDDVDDDISVYQKYLIVEITAPLDGSKVNVSREFYVYVSITNYYINDILPDGTATIGVTAGLEVVPDPIAVQLLPAIPMGTTVSVPFPWHVHCKAPGPETITVSALVIPTDGVTQTNDDSITIYQETPAKLTTTMITTETCYGISNDYTITAEINNIGGETAIGVSVPDDVKISGLATKVSGPTWTWPDPANPGVIGGQLATVSWEYHCDGAGNVLFTVTPSGTGANTMEPIHTPYDGYVDPTSASVTIHQLPLEVVITKPLGDETYSKSQTFSVEADLYNPGGGFEDLTDVTATLEWEGPANLVEGESADKIITSIPAGDTQQVAWTVHCDGSGPVTFRVKGSTIWESVPQYTYSEPAIVNQEKATKLKVKILSPKDEERWTTFIATSQEFAVTAEVTNKGEADSLNTTVTIDIYDDVASVVLPDEETIDLGTLLGGDSRVVTWTLHADKHARGEGASIEVKATGTDENSNDQKFADRSVTVKLYEAAHLVVDITDVVPVEDTGLPPYTVNVCDEFYVYYTVTNTGEADAWEVMATLSVTPEGSARPVAGEDSSYTQEIGTLTGHEQNVAYEGGWRLHCKVACESTITITASGYDEYGLTFYQEENEEIVKTTNPGMPIPERFIEPDSVTVKQLEGPTDADLAVTKTVVPTEPVGVSTEVTFTITVENLGPANATSIWVYDMLPAGLNFKDSDAEQGFYYVGGGMWSVGDLDSGTSATLTIDATVNIAGDIHNMARVDYCDQHDPITDNNAAVVKVTGEAAPPVETVVLAEGYNLMSLPLIPEFPAIETMLTGLNVEAVAHYTGGPAGDWLNYRPAADPGTNDLFFMNDGLGYWMNMSADGELVFAGWELVAETDPPSVPPSYDVVKGWNLIGFKSTTPQPAAQYLAAIADNCVMVYGFVDGSFFIAGSPGHEYLEPGLGYWIAMTDEGTIYP